jgi:hypothetical protein
MAQERPEKCRENIKSKYWDRVQKCIFFIEAKNLF